MSNAITLHLSPTKLKKTLDSLWLHFKVDKIKWKFNKKLSLLLQ